MGSDTLWGCLGRFPIYFWKCPIVVSALDYQTPENVRIPEVSAKSVLLLWHVAIIRLGRRKCLSTDSSGYLLSRHRKMCAYIYLNIQHIVV